MATTIKIGHASISEAGTANGAAGDSTTREVYINENYNISSLSPNVVLRPKNVSLADKSARACEAGCLNDNIGYSQHGTINRNSLYNRAVEVGYDLAKITTKCNTDCSAFMTVCAIAGGSKISYGTNAPTTTNMRTRFKQSGDYLVYTDAKHTTMTDYLKRGDILVREGRHTVMVLENGSQYKDEEIIAEPEDTNITLVRTIRVHSLEATITNIKSTSATIQIKLIECTNNVEKVLNNSKKWSYELKLKTLPELKTKTYQITANKLTLTDLAAGNSYAIRVIAKTSDGEIAFCSALKVFTTVPQSTQNSQEVLDLGIKKDSAFFVPVDKIYIKDKNEFKQAIIYKNT